MITVPAPEYIRPFPGIHIIFIGFSHGALPCMESVLHKLRVKDADVLDHFLSDPFQSPSVKDYQRYRSLKKELGINLP